MIDLNKHFDFLIDYYNDNIYKMTKMEVLGIEEVKSHSDFENTFQVTYIIKDNNRW